MNWRRRDDRLATLARLRELELEQARVERAAIDLSVERQRKRLAMTREELERVDRLAREQTTQKDGVSAATLQYLRDYTRWQQQTLREEQGALTTAERLAEEARKDVARRHGRLAAIERLRERRTREHSLEELRVQQKTLDDQALARPRAEAGSTEHEVRRLQN
jgi:flagellar export protein FliJ